MMGQSWVAEQLNSSSSKSEKMDESEPELEVVPSKSMLLSMVSSGTEKSYGVGMVLDIGCC